MNFFRARVGNDGAISVGEGFNLLLPASLAARADGMRLEEVIVGIRSEHLKIQRSSAPPDKNLIHGRVEVVEPQGSTTIVQLNVAGDQRLIALINEQFDAEAGSQLTLSVPGEALYLFDPATDQRAQ